MTTNEIENFADALPPEILAKRPDDPMQSWNVHFDGPKLDPETLPEVEGVVYENFVFMRTVIDPSAKVKFRGGWTCGCVVTSLPLVEKDMIAKGIIKNNIDIFQLGWNSGGVAASAGTHDKGMMIDVGQYSKRALEVWWDWGWNMQHRTRAQGFSGDHGHGGPYGCTHGSPLATWQMDVYVTQGLNGLSSNLKADGPRQNLVTFSSAIKKREVDLAKAEAAKKEKERKENPIMAITEANQKDFEEMLLRALGNQRIANKLKVLAQSATYGIDIDNDKKADTVGQVASHNYKVDVSNQAEIREIKKMVSEIIKKIG